MTASMFEHPSHTFYGGGHLFTPGTPQKLGGLASRLMDQYVGSESVLASVFDVQDPTLAADVYTRVRAKLTGSAIEDFRIDFEDGYGVRPDDEEDADVLRTADVLAAMIQEHTAPDVYGFRVKAYSTIHKPRAKRTLELFLTQFAERMGDAPKPLRVTLPKVADPGQVLELAEDLSALESKINWPTGTVKIEVVVECPQLISDDQGRNRIPDCMTRAQGRCVGLHLGPYDLMASCGISPGVMSLKHPVCDHARMAMLFAAAETGVAVCDGATHEIPVPPHRGGDLTEVQQTENREAMHRLWKTLYEYNLNGLTQGFYQGWDLHPGHLVSRYTALYTFFRSQLPNAVQRLNQYKEAETQASLTGQAFDDAASARGVERFINRALSSGAVDESEL